MSSSPPLVRLNSGHEIPLIAFGTYHLIGQTGLNHAVDAALRVGYRLFDTRKKFKNEELLARALEVSDQRDKLVNALVLVLGGPTSLQPLAEGHFHLSEMLIR